MNWKPSWKISASVVVLGLLLAGVYDGLPVGAGTLFSLPLLCVLYASLVVRGIHWIGYQDDQSVKQNVVCIATYYVLFLVTFAIGGIGMGHWGSELVMITIIVLLYGLIYSLGSFKTYFRKGWEMFLTIMVLPVLLILWLIMFGITDGVNISLTVFYEYLIIAGILYWVLFTAVILGFGKHILKHFNEPA
ncbi:hypothetical protein [Paenibacillus sp. WLX2291]|uniref:hypothetical protein n=1 Tax=Paenibacillus sp. WLX2291 TaxID=3296934 RepID=UPI0039841980